MEHGAGHASAGQGDTDIPLPQNRCRARAIGALDTALHRAIADARRTALERADFCRIWGCAQMKTASTVSSA